MNHFAVGNDITTKNNVTMESQMYICLPFRDIISQIILYLSPEEIIEYMNHGLFREYDNLRFWIDYIKYRTVNDLDIILSRDHFSPENPSWNRELIEHHLLEIVYYKYLNYAGDRFAALAEIDPTEKSRPNGEDIDINNKQLTTNTQLLYEKIYSSIGKMCMGFRTNGFLRHINILLRSGWNPNYYDDKTWSPLRMAIFLSDVKSIRLLTKYGSKLEDDILHHFDIPVKRDPEIILTLINAGAKVNIQNQQGETPLMRLLRLGYVYYENESQLIETLIDKSDLHILDDKGNSALMFAQHVYSINLLLRKGMSITHQNNEGNTPLIQAMKNDNFDILHIPEVRTSINIQNNKGETALMIAVKRMSKIGVSWLLGAGADVLIKNNKNKTALDIAMAMEKENDLTRGATSAQKGNIIIKMLKCA